MGLNNKILVISLILPILGGCKRKEEVSPTPASSAAPMFAVEKGASQTLYAAQPSSVATFLIDAPLEKIKGRSGNVMASLAIDAANLEASKGEVAVDLMSLKTETFEDKGKNDSQTEHAHNWLEVGTETEPVAREKNRWVRFTITSVSKSSVHRVVDAAEKDGARPVDLTVEGNLMIHGVSSKVSAPLHLLFKGPAEHPTSVHAESTDPFSISLKESDVKPRDAAGKFLLGALEKVGKKIDDRVQVKIAFDLAP